MVPTITTPIAQITTSALLAVLMVCLSAAVLRADETRPGKSVDLHCRMYFGCLPDLAKVRGRFN
jgi:hypothetical protein